MTTQPYELTKGSIFHLMEPDLNQEVYGLPEYLSAIPSALLNESATLFRRKYYINGSHAGFIMYMTDAAQNQEDVEKAANVFVRNELIPLQKRIREVNDWLGE